jgi:hypothetical protein
VGPRALATERVTLEEGEIALGNLDTLAVGEPIAATLDHIRRLYSYYHNRRAKLEATLASPRPGFIVTIPTHICR